MKSNRVIWLGGVLVVLAGVAWLAGAFESEFSTLDPPQWQVEPENVSAFSVYASDDTLVFKRDESGLWRMLSPISGKADSAAVVRKLRDLSAITFSSLATSNPERYARYGVDTSATRIVMTEDDQEKLVLVGSAATQGSGSFVRLGDDPRVFVASPMVTIPLDPDRWRDRTIVSLPVARVSSVTVTGTEDDFTATRGPSGWQIESGVDGAVADSAAVERWIARFSPLRGESFVEREDHAAAEAVGALTFELDTGASLSLDVRSESQRLLITRPDDGVVLSVSSGRQQALLPSSESLFR